MGVHGAKRQRFHLVELVVVEFVILLQHVLLLQPHTLDFVGLLLADVGRESVQYLRMVTASLEFDNCLHSCETVTTSSVVSSTSVLGGLEVQATGTGPR